ncbi:hypothetical protein N7U49_42450 [Streptomyces sp. AD2-2]|nr:hypothetical protein N7U49_42450 [Streptomyces sp. AD2-2]
MTETDSPDATGSNETHVRHKASGTADAGIPPRTPAMSSWAMRARSASAPS